MYQAIGISEIDDISRRCIPLSEASDYYKVMFREYPDVLTVANIQKMLGVGRHEVYHLILLGKLYALKVGKSYRIPKVKAIDYLVGKDVKSTR